MFQNQFGELVHDLVFRTAMKFFGKFSDFRQELNLGGQ